jgi:magnesium chelatase family protein
VLVRTNGFGVQRGIAEHVTVELDARAGLPAFAVVGLAPGAARDARERVQAAILNSGLAVPRRRLTVNLAPASSRRAGPEFDLAIACCVVAAEGRIDPARLARVGFFAELGLGGVLRPCSSPAAAATAAGAAGLALLVVAWADADAARAAAAVTVAAPRDLHEVVALLVGGWAGGRPGAPTGGVPWASGPRAVSPPRRPPRAGPTPGQGHCAV